MCMQITDITNIHTYHTHHTHVVSMLQVFEQINKRAFNSIINFKLYLHNGYVHLLLYFNLIAFYVVRSIQFHSNKSHFSGALNLNSHRVECKQQSQTYKICVGTSKSERVTSRLQLMSFSCEWKATKIAYEMKW